MGDDWEAARALLGDKGANLLDATRLGIPVPPGLTVTTEACIDYLADDQFPEGLWEQQLAAVHVLESRTGKNFGDTDNPLLVSCRSGARFSMPGMMDTILNIGLNDELAARLATRTAWPGFAYDLCRRLVHRPVPAIRSGLRVLFALPRTNRPPGGRACSIGIALTR